ncbi:MAG: cobalamin-binding protein [Colwellia sp.]
MHYILKYILCSVLFLLFAISTSNQSKAEKSNSLVQKKPSIVALSPHIVEMLYDIGAGSQIIGTTEFSDYPEQAKKIPRIGNYLRIQIERVIELQPDLIIAWQSGNPSDDLSRLTQLGFTIVYSQPNTFEDIAKEMRYFGKITDHEEKGEQQANQFLKKLSKIKSHYQNKQAITGFYELWPRPLTTIAKNSWPQQFLDVCKVNNPFQENAAPYPQVNIEQILEKSIQIIIQPLSINQPEKSAYHWQKWPSIAAVKNKRIIQPNADALHRMTKRSLKQLKSLCVTIDETRQWLQNKNEF